MDDDLRNLRKSLGDSLHGTFCAAFERDANLDLVRELVFATVRRWWEDHPGIEDHTVECVVCHKLTTKTNRIESVHSGTPKYLCERCHDGIIGAPVIHHEPCVLVVHHDPHIFDDHRVDGR